MLPKAEGQEGQGIGSGDMPEVNGAESKNRQVVAKKAWQPEGIGSIEILNALREAKGNVPLAASMLDISVAKFDRALYLAKETKKIAREIRRWRRQANNMHFLVGSMEQIEEDIQRKAILYKHEAMDVLMAIAMQPLNENNPYHNQIKLQAAMKLVDLPGVKLDQRQSEEVASTLRLLDEEFRKNAPRLRVIRETVREAVYEDGTTVEGQAVRLPSP